MKWPELTTTVDLLHRGGTILYPTDTIWGLGCDALNPEAVAKVFDIKNRPATKSCIVLVQNEAQLAQYVESIPSSYAALANKWDRAVTFIFPHAKGFQSPVVAADGSVAIRIPKDEFCLELLAAFGKPLLSTSANVSGAPSPEFFAAISEEVKSKVDAIIQYRQDDNTPKQASMIVKLMEEDFVIIRE